MPTPSAAAAPIAPPPASAIALSKLNASKLPAGIQVKGKVVDGGTWRDRNGDNVIVLSSIENTKTNATSLFANHYVLGRGAPRLLREIREHVECPEFDNVTEFHAGSLGVTDLDGDGIGEVAFAYRADCVSDMSPVTVKLLLLENGDKYILRGTTRIEDPGGAYGGDLKVDPSFTKGPKEFLAHAKALWERESPHHRP